MADEKDGNSNKNKKDKRKIEQAGFAPPGMFGTPDQEAVPRLFKKGNEVVLEGLNNAFVILEFLNIYKRATEF